METYTNGIWKNKYSNYHVVEEEKKSPWKGNKKIKFDEYKTCIRMTVQPRRC